LTPAQRTQVRFVLELVDRLAAAENFDINQLRSPSTGKPLGPAIERMRAELERHDEADTSAGAEPCGS
jgi:hypothetical protein